MSEREFQTEVRRGLLIILRAIWRHWGLRLTID